MERINAVCYESMITHTYIYSVPLDEKKIEIRNIWLYEIIENNKGFFYSPMVLGRFIENDLKLPSKSSKDVNGNESKLDKTYFCFID